MKPTTLALLATLTGGVARAHPIPQEQPQWVVPQARSFVERPGEPGVVIDGVEARVDILEGVASTTLLVSLANPGPRVAEAVLLLPVPDGASVSAFDFEGAGAETTAKILAADEARELYGRIVAKAKDPALLEFAGQRAVRTSVFPVPAGGEQRVTLTYEQVLERDGLRVDYVLPRSESLDVRVPWTISVSIRSREPIATAYSPSHPIHLQRAAAGELKAVLAASSVAPAPAVRALEPGAFRLSYLHDGGGVSASLVSYPDAEDPAGGGWFLLLAGLPPTEGEAQPIRREVTLVIDRSGSMGGAKIEQAKKAALQVLEGLRPGESIQILAYSDAVERFAPRPVVKDEESMARARAYVGAIHSGGGTDIHSALRAAVTQEATPDALPLVLFLTDGLPTVGEVREHEIAAMVAGENRAARRIFTFGVGHDVNAPLLDRLSTETRATSTYVVPDEDVEVAVGQVFRRLEGPRLADLELATVDGEGVEITTAVSELLPKELPDLFDGERLVVLGRYARSGGLAFRLRGETREGPRTYAFAFDTAKASTRNAFVPRLWASRRIAWLTDRIRRIGAEEGIAMTGEGTLDHPRFRELSDEILRLSTRFGILSEFTSFLATEGTDLDDLDGLRNATACNLDDGAVRTRSGQSAVNCSRNYVERIQQSTLNFSNQMWNAAGERVEVSNVQQVADRAFFRRGERWVDGHMVGGALEADREVRFGSPEYEALLQRLVDEGRQAVLSLKGEVLIELDGERILIVGSGC